MSRQASLPEETTAGAMSRRHHPIASDPASVRVQDAGGVGGGREGGGGGDMKTNAGKAKANKLAGVPLRIQQRARAQPAESIPVATPSLRRLLERLRQRNRGGHTSGHKSPPPSYHRTENRSHNPSGSGGAKDDGPLGMREAYAKRHGLRKFFNELEEILLQERPSNPLEFLFQAIQETASSAKKMPPRPVKKKLMQRRRNAHSQTPDRPKRAFRPRFWVPEENEREGFKSEPMNVGCFVRPDMQSIKRSISVPNGMAKLKSFDDLPFASSISGPNMDPETKDSGARKPLPMERAASEDIGAARKFQRLSTEVTVRQSLHNRRTSNESRVPAKNEERCGESPPKSNPAALKRTVDNMLLGTALDGSPLENKASDGDAEDSHSVPGHTSDVPLSSPGTRRTISTGSINTKMMRPASSSGSEEDADRKPALKKYSAPKLDTGHHTPSVGMLVKPLLLRQATENFRFSSYVGCDIGGTLAKITFFEPYNCDRVDIKKRSEFLKSSTTYGKTGRRDPKLAIEIWGGRFHFLSFQTKHLDGAVSILKEHSAHHEFANASVPVTGGGAYKYEQYLKNELDMGVHKVDELTCLLTGLNFTLKHVPDECFYLEHRGDNELPVRNPHCMSGVFPYLLVNIGSGVSILKVESENQFKRVGGSCLGGGTYWGLCRLLLGVKTFEEAMMYGMEGNHHNVDMLVGDIYGGDYSRFNLKASTVASAFGKMVMQDDVKTTKSDAAASLLHMIGANIAQLAYMTARENNVPRILFAGNFLRMNMSSAIYLSSSINYWSQGKMRALFLRHEGYFGSLGALLKSKDASKTSLRITEITEQIPSKDQHMDDEAV